MKNILILCIILCNRVQPLYYWTTGGFDVELLPNLIGYYSQVLLYIYLLWKFVNSKNLNDTVRYGLFSLILVVTLLRYLS